MVAVRLGRRRVVRSVAFCALVSLSPVAMLVKPVVADTPAAVTVAGLSQGARGDAVRQVQQALINQGIPVAGGADGVFGAATSAALRQFQAAKGIAQTGVVDDATALALGLASSPVLGLTQGTRGESVTQLQQRLIASGISVRGGADGVFGSGTADALKQFQSAKGLPSTGVVDAATAAALGSVQVPSSSGPSQSSDTQSSASGSLVGLKVGSRGETVKQLQQQLIAAGHRVPGGADGVFGVATATSLSSFQSAAGLKPTAIVDDATVAALAAAPRSGGGAGAGGGQGAASPLLGLKYGSTGGAVKTLQETLLKAGVNVRGGADGVFGLSTQNALKQYQQAAGLSASGRVDEQTASALASGRSVAGGGASSGLVGLKSGSLGSSVRDLQQALIKAGISIRGGADGIFGPATAQAVSAFQTAQGLPVTGVADAATVAALANPKPISGGGGGGAAAPSGGFPQFGEKGARVISLQSALMKAGITVRGGVDGSFGAGTSAAVMDFQRAKGLRVTGRIDDATAAQLGLGAQQPPAAPDVSTVTLAAFPVQGRCYFTDTWMAVRSGGRAHLGVDIIAPQGKLIYAVTDGTITRVYTDHPGSLAGNGLRLTQGDGTYFFYAHMVSIAEGIAVGSKVTAGQVIGYVGSTGSSATNHLHFEVHPKGGSAVNPYPMVKAIDGCKRT